MKDLKSKSSTAQVSSLESLIDYNLSLTPEMRLIRHQNALDTVNELKKAGEKLYERPESSAQASTRK